MGHFTQCEREDRREGKLLGRGSILGPAEEPVDRAELHVSLQQLEPTEALTLQIIIQTNRNIPPETNCSPAVNVCVCAAVDSN